MCVCSRSISLKDTRVNSNIDRDTTWDIINVIHEAVVLAKNILRDHYAEIASLGNNTSRRSKYKQVEDIIDGIVKIDATFSEKEELPVVFVASDMRAISQQKPMHTTQEIRSMERPSSNQINSNGSKMLQRVEGNLKDEQLTTESGTILDDRRLNTLRRTINRINSAEIKGDWQLVGKQQPCPRPRPIYGNKKRIVN